jgi:methylmalonyl-CoA/ethylmalonyl-CoA epimerase
MDRPLIVELRERLAQPGQGGSIEAGSRLDVDALSALANEYGAHFAVVRGPASKRSLLDALADGLGFPSWFGHNWDALEELLAHPETALTGPVIVAWTDTDRLPSADAAVFRSIVASAAQARIDRGHGPLLVVVEPRTADQRTVEAAAGTSEVNEVSTAKAPRGPKPAALGPASDATDVADARGPARTRAKVTAASVPDHVRRLGRVHHIALIVRSIDDALAFWRDALGLDVETIMDIPQDRVRIAFLGVGESKVELVEPTDETTGVARFLDSRGEGFHHVCFEVANLTEALLRLEIDGLELIDTAPRRGAEGPVAFIHPRSCHGVLVELIEAAGGPAWKSLGY